MRCPLDVRPKLAIRGGTTWDVREQNVTPGIEGSGAAKIDDETRGVPRHCSFEESVENRIGPRADEFRVDHLFLRTGLGCRFGHQRLVDPVSGDDGSCRSFDPSF